MLQAIAGYDRDDLGSVNLPVPDYTTALNMGIYGCDRCYRHFYESRLPPEDETRRAFEAALQELTKLGALLEEVKLRELEDYDDCKVIISEAEFFAVHEKDLLERFQDYGANLRFRAAPAGSSGRSTTSRLNVSAPNWSLRCGRYLRAMTLW